jgi:hypothetical protein
MLVTVKLKDFNGKWLSKSVECVTGGHGRCKSPACECWCHPKEPKAPSPRPTLVKSK